jgi:hypothetical protein
MTNPEEDSVALSDCDSECSEECVVVFHRWNSGSLTSFGAVATLLAVVAAECGKRLASLLCAAD